jgi:hypothetical protein
MNIIISLCYVWSGKVLRKNSYEFERTIFQMVYFLPFGKTHDTVSLRCRGFAVVYYSVTLRTPRTYDTLSFYNVRVISLN